MHTCPANCGRFQALTTTVCPVQLSTPANAQGAPVVPFTVPEQTAIELVFRGVLPPLSNGLGPRWARVLGYSPSKTAAEGVNVTLLMYNSQTPLSEFLTVSQCWWLCWILMVEVQRLRCGARDATSCRPVHAALHVPYVMLLSWAADPSHSVPTSGFVLLQLVDGALTELSALLALSGLPVTLTQQYVRPVAGYTLEVRVNTRTTSAL
jgi:hypothetical protein